MSFTNWDVMLRRKIMLQLIINNKLTAGNLMFNKKREEKDWMRKAERKIDKAIKRKRG